MGALPRESLPQWSETSPSSQMPYSSHSSCSYKVEWKTDCKGIVPILPLPVCTSCSSFPGFLVKPENFSYRELFGRAT